MNLKPVQCGVSLLLFGCLVGGTTVDEFLVGQPLGELLTDQSIPCVERVQSNPGKHKGHRLLRAKLPLVPVGGKTSKRYPYALGYAACLDREAHPAAVELIAREGMCGIGVSRPSGANWYGGSCVDVLVNGKGLGAFRPAFHHQDYESGAVAVCSTWATAPDLVSLTFSHAPEDAFFRVQGRVAGSQGDALEVRLRAFPSVTKKTGKRVVWTADRAQEGVGKLVAGREDWWLLLGDSEFDLGNGGGGAGPCAVAYSPAQV
ncbi:MAG: hypothetical protein HON70_22685, partial [Lentisphaerae bacterium]|nr:hypothetical protein [Lentisphaerota bacterium]